MLVIFDEFLKLNSNAGNKRFQRELLLGKHGTIIIDVKGDYFDGKSINTVSYTHLTLPTTPYV